LHARKRVSVFHGAEPRVQPINPYVGTTSNGGIKEWDTRCALTLELEESKTCQERGGMDTSGMVKKTFDVDGGNV